KSMRSIGRYLQIRLFIGVTLILAFGSLILAGAMRFLDVREFDAALETKARTLATLIFRHRQAVEIDFADEYLPEFESESDTEYYQVQLFDGTRAENLNVPGSVELPVFLESVDEAVFHNITLPDGRNGRL